MQNLKKSYLVVKNKNAFFLAEQDRILINILLVDILLEVLDNVFNTKEEGKGGKEKKGKEEGGVCSSPEVRFHIASDSSYSCIACTTLSHGHEAIGMV